MLGRHGGGGGGRHGGHHGGHGGRGRGRGWGGGYPYYGYPYFDDFYYRTPDLQSQPQIIVVDKGRDSGAGINWPTIAISMALSAFMLMKMGH